METFYRDLLHDKVSRKISFKASRLEGQYFVGILAPNKHPSRCDSKDFFWTKVRPQHSIKQIAAVYSDKHEFRVRLSDGDKVLNDRTRFRTLDHFHDGLVVLWAQKDLRTHSLNTKSSNAACSTEVERDTMRPSTIEASKLSTPLKRRSISPACLHPSKRNKDEHPDVLESETFSCTAPETLQSLHGGLEGPPAQDSPATISNEGGHIQNEILREDRSGLHEEDGEELMPISPPATIFTSEVIDDTSETRAKSRGVGSSPQQSDSKVIYSISSSAGKSKLLKDMDIRRWIPQKPLKLVEAHDIPSPGYSPVRSESAPLERSDQIVVSDVIRSITPCPGETTLV